MRFLKAMEAAEAGGILLSQTKLSYSTWKDFFASKPRPKE